MSDEAATDLSALQQLMGNRAATGLVQRHQGEHSGPHHTHRIREVPIGTDVRALSGQVPEILEMVHSLRPDANLAEDQVPKVSSVNSIVVWTADPSFRTFPLDELRTISRLGFVEPELDVTLLTGRSASLLRVLRGRWHQATHLVDFVEEHDIRNAEPVDLAVWWEAAGAIDQRDLLADRLGEAIVQRLVSEDVPQRWWPAVLAALTDWIAP